MTGLHFAPLLLAFGLSSCTLPDTPLWNSRETGAVTGMPAEMITKVVLHGTARSFVSNPASSLGKGVSMTAQRSRLLAENVLTRIALLKQAHPGGVRIEEGLDAVGLNPGLPGKVDFLIDGDEFFPALERSIEQAHEQIDSQVFIFDNDDVATALADRLKVRSREVRCRVLMDRLGSISSWWNPPPSPMPEGFRPPSSMPHYLWDNSQVKVRTSQNPWLVADHSKLIVIDRREAYLGGMNFGREYRYDWHDLMVRVTGPVTTELQNHFDRAWKYQGMFGDLRALFHRRLRPDLSAHDPSHFPIRILRTTPWRIEIEKAILAAVRMSRERIFLQNSYLTSELLLRELLAARARGVEVTLIYPSDNDSPFLEDANRRFAANLLAHGARVYRYPSFSHVKAVLVDDWVCLGSANFDGLSMRINGELNIAFSDPEKVAEVHRRVFLKDLRASRQLRREDFEIAPFSLKIPLLQQL